MKTIALIAKHLKPEAVVLAEALKARYPELTFLAEDHLAKQLKWPASSDAEMRERAELVMVLGGDGTLIAAARILEGRSVPILGVNLGSLGFMTEIPLGDTFTVLDEVLAGKGRISSRMKLACRLYRDGQVIRSGEALNDVVINKGVLARIADHETWLDSHFVALFKADGVICATPTGSTAYSLSAGGPIVHPSLDCVIITPICPHALTQKPIVVPPDQTLRLVLKSEVSDVFLTIDGQVGTPLQQNDRIEIERSPNRLLLVSNPALDYFGVLRQKLHWGER